MMFLLIYLFGFGATFYWGFAESHLRDDFDEPAIDFGDFCGLSILSFIFALFWPVIWAGILIMKGSHCLYLRLRGA